MSKNYPLLLKDYKRILEERIAKGKFKKSSMENYLVNAPNRILEAVVKILPVNAIGAMIKETDPNITNGFYKEILHVVKELKSITNRRKEHNPQNIKS